MVKINNMSIKQFIGWEKRDDSTAKEALKSVKKYKQRDKNYPETLRVLKWGNGKGVLFPAWCFKGRKKVKVYWRSGKITLC
jgi:hypothetical protein